MPTVIWVGPRDSGGVGVVFDMLAVSGGGSVGAADAA
jgi:hypothetical protein